MELSAAPPRRFQTLRRVAQLLSLVTVIYGIYRWFRWRQVRRVSAEIAVGPVSSLAPASVHPGPFTYRRIVIATRGLLCTEGEGAEVTLLPSGIDFVRGALCRGAVPPNILLITQCQYDETEAAIIQELEAVGVRGGVEALFCSTPDGILHIARSLEPDLYIDVSPSRVFQIRPFLRDAAAAVCISDPKQQQEAAQSPQLSTEQLQVITLLPTLQDLFTWS